ncbi:hypothetical protein BJ912DRAFT_222544 [Pholiota molesta]|nr:hypothetical protein BJ912DRAFT_222544 [Pholiota molesta]
MNAKAAKRLGLTLPPTTPNGTISLKGAQLQGLFFQEDLTTPTQAKSPSRRLSTLLSPSAVPPATPPVSTPPIPIYSAKVANRLGVNSDGTPVRIEMRKRKPKKKSPLVQSPGLLVWPSVYLPLTPVELEMHACKNIHTLLGCRAALADFFATHTDKDEQRLVEDDEFDDIMWEYECFRRRRLNWPSEITDPYDDDELNNSSMFSSDSVPHKHSRKSGSPPTTPAADSDSFNGQYRRDDLTHVRTIRVFHAVKSGPPSLSNVL